MIKDVKTAANGKSIVFTSLGHIYTKELPNGTPKRLTNLTDFEAEPNFSPDGTSIVFVTWNDENLGAIYSINLNGSGLQKITTKKGIYRTPSFDNT